MSHVSLRNDPFHVGDIFSLVDKLRLSHILTLLKVLCHPVELSQGMRSL